MDQANKFPSRTIQGTLFDNSLHIINKRGGSRVYAEINIYIY